MLDISGSIDYKILSSSGTGKNCFGVEDVVLCAGRVAGSGENI
jgi:hypothetical protein